MFIKSMLFGAIVAVPALVVVSPGQAIAQTQCTSATAQASMDAEVLCGCGSVTREMISYIQQHRDFEIVLAQTSMQCPALANLLGDVPTASIPQPEDDGDSTDGDGTDGDGTDGDGTDGDGTDGDGTDGGDGDGTDGDGDGGGTKGNNGGGNGGEGSSPGQGGGANDDES